MLKLGAEQQLKDYVDREMIKKQYIVNDRIRFFTGYGHSNCTVIEGKDSLILIDALDSDERGKRLREELDSILHKPVKTLIYTHGHPDHRGGAGAFQDTVEEIIAFAPHRPVLKYMDHLSAVLNKRTIRQFGAHLTEEELITQGLGIREGQYCNEGGYKFLAPTTVYTEEQVEREIDGVKIKLVSAVGETDDQIFVWLPDDEVLCCGDNYYACWPNLYAIRGSQYRDIAAWADSLGVMLTYPAKFLLPGHTRPVFGEDAIRDRLTCYKEAIETILLQTLDCMNRGMNESDTVKAVKLPESLQNKPFLGEFYGTISSSVRAIYHGYLGWFDGNPTKLNPLPDEEYAVKLVDLIGGDKLLEEVGKAYENSSYQLGLQFCDLLIQADIHKEKALAEKKKGLLLIANMATSCNERHYYLESAGE